MSYRVEITDTADGEAESISDKLALRISVEYAGRWYVGLIAAMEDLALFPRACPIAPEYEDNRQEIRRMLYYGPSRRSGGTIYRI